MSEKEKQETHILSRENGKIFINLFNRLFLSFTILIIILNAIMLIILTYYGNIIAFLFLTNIFYIISYYRKMRMERIRNELG